MKGYGWAKPANTKKFHIFFNNRSLCCKWMFMGETEQVSATDLVGIRSADDCQACVKQIRKIEGSVTDKTHGCHDCGEERFPRIVAGKLTCPECGSTNIVCISETA
jgi:ribosomal protein L37AE/L43A